FSMSINFLSDWMGTSGRFVQRSQMDVYFFKNHLALVVALVQQIPADFFYQIHKFAIAVHILPTLRSDFYNLNREGKPAVFPEHLHVAACRVNEHFASYVQIFHSMIL